MSTNEPDKAVLFPTDALFILPLTYFRLAHARGDAATLRRLKRARIADAPGLRAM